MQIRKRLPALLFRLAAFAGFLTALIFYMTALGPSWRSLSLFSIQVGMAMAVVLAFEVLFNAIDMRHGLRGMPAGFYMPFKLPLMSFCIIAMAAFFFDTVLYYPIEATAQGIIYHAVLGIVPLIDYLFFDEKGTVKWYDCLSAMLYPIIYLSFVWTRPLIWPDATLYNGPSGMFPYPILNPANEFFWVGSIVLFLLVAAFLVGMSFFNDFLAGKFRKRDTVI
ncbi:MAG: hypothetical protein K6F32_02140 [Bacilli bacterium]|nr:hypothetical protein [Bacilli bacterium]